MWATCGQMVAQIFLTTCGGETVNSSCVETSQKPNIRQACYQSGAPETGIVASVAACALHVVGGGVQALGLCVVNPPGGSVSC